jgi:hypothetical protein
MKRAGIARRCFLVVALVAAATLIQLHGGLRAQTKASPPVVVTSLGQSLDAFQLQLAVKLD